MDSINRIKELSLTGNLAENWRIWIQSFEIYALASGLQKKEEKVKCATLLHMAGVEAIKVYNTFKFDQNQSSEKLEDLKRKFQEYCEPRKNLTYSRHQFFSRNQKKFENIDTYVMELKVKAKLCEFDILNDSLIRDRIICGVYNKQLQSTLLREGDIDLKRTIEICEATEIVENQMKEMSDLQTEEVFEIKGKSKNMKDDRYKFKNYTSQNKADNVFYCKRCGTQHKRRNCPAYGKFCEKCNKKNHLKEVCKTKKITVHALEDSEESLFIDSIDHIDHTNKNWNEIIEIAKIPMSFKLDTGAQTNIMILSDFKKLNINLASLQDMKNTLTGYCGNKIKTLGQIVLKCKCRDKHYNILFTIVDTEKSPSILGTNACDKLNLIKRVLNVNENNQSQCHNKDVISNDCILKDYKDVFEGLGCLPGKHHIELKQNVKPIIQAPRRIPITLKHKVKQELLKMEQLGIIVKQDQPTEWVNSMVVVSKKNKIRICIDPQPLNNAIKREHHPLKTLEEIITDIPNAKIFTVLDASTAFWQKELDEESSKLCTFNTFLGRYRFTRLPYGINSASELYQKEISAHLDTIEGVETVIDDILVYGKTVEEHDIRLKQLMEKLRKINLKLNPDKIQLRVKTIKYLGHLITDKGLKIDPDKTKAICEMKTPENKQALRRFLGTIQYIAKFIPNLSQKDMILRQLLSKRSEWIWNSEHQKCFEELKLLVTNAPILRLYDVDKPTTLSVDASSHGLGATILQNGLPIAYASRSLTTTQQKYAQIEKETLAIVYGCQKYHQYIYAKDIIVETDHKPLEQIFRKPLSELSPRLQRMRMRVQQYNLTIKYKPGKELLIADMLSREHLSQTEEILEDEEMQIATVDMHLPISDTKLKLYKKATQEDDQLRALIHQIQNGWSDEKKDTPQEIQQYWKIKDSLTYVDELLFKDNKLIIPKTERKNILKLIHETHLGIVLSKQRARDILYWPGMSQQIQDMVEKCEICNKSKKDQQRQPMTTHEIPNRPWAKLGTDICYVENKIYLVLIDYYSKYPEVININNNTAATVIDVLKTNLARHGLIDELISDNGPPFNSSEFKTFAEQWNFTHKTSSPNYPRSDGQVERTIQTVKNLIKKALLEKRDPRLALLEFRNTPSPITNKSPAQILMSRRLKTFLPASQTLLQPEVQTGIREQLMTAQRKQKFYYDRGTKKLKQLEEGENIIFKLKDKWTEAKVLNRHKLPNSYILKTKAGKIYRRNRQHIRSIKQNTSNEAELGSENRNPINKNHKQQCIKQHQIRKTGRMTKYPEKYKNFV